MFCPHILTITQLEWNIIILTQHNVRFVSYLAEGSQGWSCCIWGGTGATGGVSGRSGEAEVEGRVCGSGGALSGGVGGGVGNSTVSWRRWAGRAGATACCGGGDGEQRTGSLLSAASVMGGLRDKHTRVQTWTAQANTQRVTRGVHIRTTCTLVLCLISEGFLKVIRIKNILFQIIIWYYIII